MGSAIIPALAIGAAAFTGGASLGFLGADAAATGIGAAAAGGLGTASEATMAAVAAGSAGASGVAASTLIPSLSTVGTAASLVGTGISALGQIGQGRAQSESAKYNAELATRNATMAGNVGEENVANEQLKTRAQAGAIIANQAAKGIDVNSGSAVDVQSSASAMGELNALTIRSRAAQQAYGYQTQSALDTSEAANATAAGDVGAAGTAFKGLGQVAMQYSNPNSGIGTIN